VSYFTLRIIIILMETIKDLYIARLPRRWAICRSRCNAASSAYGKDDVPAWERAVWYNADCASARLGNA
jgi:hypothetical protein